eukprot:scaffold9833_cov102-Skeletonema_marinoi.AAC.1
MPHQVTYDVVGTLIDQPLLEPWQRCFYTIMANYNALTEAVDCRIHIPPITHDSLVLHPSNLTTATKPEACRCRVT